MSTILTNDVAWHHYNLQLGVELDTMCITGILSTKHPSCRAGGLGLAASVLVGPVFSQGKSKIPFLQNASNKQSASVILGLIRLIILSYNR